MPLVSTEQMLRAAKEGGYAVAAFNAENLEMAQGILEAAQALRAPVILQTTPSTVRYANPRTFFGLVRALAEGVDVPVALHLDHGDSFALCAQALRAGYTSIMIDGSRLPLEQNIALTRSVVDMCAPSGVPVEGELGHVGGKEDDLEQKAEGYTDPEEAVVFERETQVSSLAVGVGTAHGIYAAPPVLNTDLVERLSGCLTVPLVLHGASGLAEGAVQECIRRGISKVNFATDLRIAYTRAVRQVLEDEAVFDPKCYGRAGREAVRQLVGALMHTCGCAGRAN